ncbi:hypothetical protein A2U01_0113570, partial [Trifolium medium]|nr:hypothetical protein [Trifolium medium]
CCLGRFGFGRWRDAQGCGSKATFLLEFARRAAGAGAARSTALFSGFFSWLLRGARRWSARRAGV